MGQKGAPQDWQLLVGPQPAESLGSFHHAGGAFETCLLAKGKQGRSIKLAEPWHAWRAVRNLNLWRGNTRAAHAMARTMGGGAGPPGRSPLRPISEFPKFRLPTDPNQFTDSHRPVPKEGRWPTSSTRGGMRWTRVVPLTN